MEKGIYIEGFWERLEEAVRLSGLTKTEIARRIGCDRKSLYELAGRHRMLQSGYMAKFCVVTKISSDWLLGLKKEMR